MAQGSISGFVAFRKEAEAILLPVLRRTLAALNRPSHVPIQFVKSVKPPGMGMEVAETGIDSPAVSCQKRPHRSDQSLGSLWQPLVTPLEQLDS